MVDILDFKTFEEIIKSLKEYDELSKQVDTISEKLSKDFPPLNIFGLAHNHVQNTLTLLSHLFNDKEGDWIGYWIYELDYGKNYKSGCITEQDGTEIKIGTVKELYNFLVKEMMINKINNNTKKETYKKTPPSFWDYMQQIYQKG